MGRKYAKGKHALAECQRSGMKMAYRDLVEDGHIPGLLVHPDWYEPKHPQETVPDMNDPVALYRPAPEISVPVGEGDPDNPDGGTTPVAPSGAVTGTIAFAMVEGQRIAVVDTAITYQIGAWLFIELDGGGTFFVSRITSEANHPFFTIPFATAFVGTASAGNNYYIEA